MLEDRKVDVEEVSFPIRLANKDFLSTADTRCGQARGLDITAVSTYRPLPILLSITST